MVHSIEIYQFSSPNRPQNQTFSLKRSSILRCSRFCVRKSSSASLGVHFGSTWGPLVASSGPLGAILGVLQSAFQTCQETPKRPPRGSQKAPRGPFGASNEASEAFKNSVSLRLCGSVALWLCGSVSLCLCVSVSLCLRVSVAGLVGGREASRIASSKQQ